MITKASIGIIVIAALCFGASFLATVAVRSEDVPATRPILRSPLARQLQLGPEQAKIIEAHDPKFPEDVRILQKELAQARSMLAAAFEDEGVTDDEIRQRVEATIEVHNRLERRVVEYLISVRDHLTPQQKGQLYGLCAEKVRAGGKRWRGGRGRQGDASDDGCRCGKGRGRGRGHGRGQGRGPEPVQGHGLDRERDGGAQDGG